MTKIRQVYRSVIALQFISIYAAYLYDSVKLYAWALDKMLRMEERVLTDEVISEVASNGTRVIDTIIKNRTYMSESFRAPSRRLSSI